MNQSGTSIESEDDFPKTKIGWHERWDSELVASRKASKHWHTRGNKVVNRYLDQRGAGEEDWFKLNIFHRNINTLKNMLYGNVPKVDVSRKFGDADDDVSRVASVLLERILNCDIARPADSYATTLRDALEDRLVPGLGEARIRYEVEIEEVDVEAITITDPDDEEKELIMAEGYTEERVLYEDAPVDYVHWRDVLWSPCRTYRDLRWKAYRAYLTRDELVKRFGEKVGMRIPLTKTSLPDIELNYSGKESPNKDAWARAEIWEIWDKETEKVFWFCFDWPKILDEQDDPLELEGFFPSAKPMAANTTTTAFMPVPDYFFAQDLYNQIDKLETRISLITEAVKVVGVYDASAVGLKRMLVEGVENDLIPVDNWAMFAEKGGISGTVDWFPVAEIAATLTELMKQRDDNIALLDDITGMREIMRGGMSNKNPGGAVTATETVQATQFGSIDIQALQEEFAEFASALMRLKVQVISKHFSPETIIVHSNAESLNKADQELIQPAIELIQNLESIQWKVEVKPESVAMVDYASMRQERTQFIAGTATFIQAATPMVQMDKAVLPYMLEILKWGMAGYKGSNEIEGVMDQAIEALQRKEEEQQGQKEPSPEELKAKAAKEAAQQDEQFAQAAHQRNMELETHKHTLKMQELQATVKGEVEETTAISATKIKEIDANAESTILVEQVKHDLDIKAEEHETDEIIERERAKIDLKPETSSE